MTVAELKELLGAKVLNEGVDLGRQVERAYVCDLLSWVMGRAQEGDAWLTIMSNQNVAAVALMAGTACVILTEGVSPDPALLQRAREKGVNLLGSGLSTFDTAAVLSRLLKA